jgi:hypothetical protein
LVFGFFGLVYGENRLRYRKPNFLDTKTETEPNYKKTEISVRFGTVRFDFRFMVKMCPPLARALPLARPAQPPLSSSSSQLCCALAPESKAVASQRPLLITQQPEDYYHAPSARAFQWPTYRRYFLGIPSPSGPANFLENSLLPPSATSLVGPRSFGRSC